MNYCVLYNPFAGTVNDVSFQTELKNALQGDKLDFYDLTVIDFSDFFAKLEPETGIIIAGGDGTLNRFINDTAEVEIASPVYYYAAGNGNDFWHDLGKVKGDKPVHLAEHVKNLPTVTVNGKTSKFINGVGYGIDGYCCEVGDKLKAEGKDVNYTSIAIKGLLFNFKPRNATVTVDGVTRSYKKVWIAPAMLGRFYGGGMMPTPAQDRLNKDNKLSLCIFHGSASLKRL